MIGDFLEILKTYGLGGLGTFLGGLNIWQNSRKLDKPVFYTFRDEVKESLAKGNIKFSELEGAQRCLPEMQRDMKKLLQGVAAIKAVMKIEDRDD